MRWRRVSQVCVLLSALAALVAASSARRPSPRDGPAKRRRVMKYLNDTITRPSACSSSRSRRATARHPRRGDAQRGDGHAARTRADPAQRPGPPDQHPSRRQRAASGRTHAATFRNARRPAPLFEHDYPVAWGDQSKRPDAFLTGEVVVGKDMKTMEVVVLAFDRKNPERLQEVARVSNVPVDRNVLVGIGQSFALARGLKHRLLARSMSTPRSTPRSAMIRTSPSTTATTRSTSSLLRR